MVTCFSRSLLIVKEETPAAYFLLVTPGMMLSNLADCHSVVRPSFWATALNRSTSKPSTVLPSVARNSLGAYVASTPMVMVPSDLMASGTICASALSADGDAVVDDGLPPLDSWPPLLPPQAATRATAAAIAAV